MNKNMISIDNKLIEQESFLCKTKLYLYQKEQKTLEKVLR